MNKELMLELKRKGLHLFAIFIPLSLLVLDNLLGMILIVSTAFIAISIDLLRMRENFISKIYSKFFTSMLRQHEKQGTFTGATFFFISLCVSYLLFYRVLGLNIRVVVAAYVAFMLGDAAAALVGKFLGKIKIYKGKTLEGFFACLVTCAIVVVAIVGIDYKVLFILPLLLSLLELFIIKLDDNLVVPLVALGVMVIVL